MKMQLCNVTCNVLPRPAAHAFISKELYLQHDVPLCFVRIVKHANQLKRNSWHQNFGYAYQPGMQRPTFCKMYYMNSNY